MREYEIIQRVEKIKVVYGRGHKIEEGQESKVYKIYTRRYPSGTKYELLVWSNTLGQCVWVREDDVCVLAMAQTPIHTIH